LIDPDCQYNIIRCDRKDRIGGGVCVLISKELQYSEVCNCNFRNIYELCCFDIVYSANRFRLFSIYRKPGFSADSIDGMLSLVNCLSTYINVSYPCIVTGDLNCSHVDWTNLNARADGINDTFLNFVVTNSLNQLVDIPTRGKNILDIVLTNEPLIISTVRVENPFSNSDHCQVMFDILVVDNQSAKPDATDQRCWRKADFDGMSEYLQEVDWLSMLTTNLTADSLWNTFSQEINKAIEIFVPSTKASCLRKNKLYPPSIRRAFVRKRCLWRRHRDNPDDCDLAASYKRAELKCHLLVRNYEIKKERDIINDNNIGGFYKFVNKKISL